MSIIVLDYAIGSVMKINLTEKQAELINDDADTFIERIAEKYGFRVKDVNWILTDYPISEHTLPSDF